MKLTAESTVINDGKLNTNINNAQDTANTASTKADNAQATANLAKNIADNTAQYFWFTSSGADTGAHISEKTQAQFIANPSGSNLLARSNGIAVRDGLAELATFTASGSRIGAVANSTSRVETSATGISFINRNSSGVDKTVFIEPRATEDTTRTRIGTTNAGVVIYDSGATTTSYALLGCREVSGSSPSILKVGYGSVTVSNADSGTTFEATSRGVETPYSYYSGGYKLITTGTTTVTGSAIAAGSSGELTTTATGSTSIAKTGYTPIGLVGWELTGTNNALLIPFRAYISGTTAHINLRNTATSSSITPTVVFHVLYIATAQGI